MTTGFLRVVPYITFYWFWVLTLTVKVLIAPCLSSPRYLMAMYETCLAPFMVNKERIPSSSIGLVTDSRPRTYTNELELSPPIHPLVRLLFGLSQWEKILSLYNCTQIITGDFGGAVLRATCFVLVLLACSQPQYPCSGRQRAWLHGKGSGLHGLRISYEYCLYFCCQWVIIYYNWI